MEAAFQKKIGILGGGQLGKMFIQEAYNYNAQIYILDPAKDAPCASMTPHFVCGNFKDYDEVLAFGKDLDIISIEFEDVNADALEALEKMGKKVYPQASVLKIIQDKGLQKAFYDKESIPTAPYYLVESKAEIKSDKFPFFQKLRKSGYDGYGVRKVSNNADLESCFDAASVIEEMADLDYEISVIVARNESGEIAAFPPVAMEFNAVAHMVEYLYAPAPVSKEIEAKSKSIAIELIQKLDMVGILAVEMFVLKNGEIWVNEVAPRPHNSGHHTIEANYVSQFDIHFRSICNLPLGNTEGIMPAVMINLLGDPAYSGPAHYEGIEKVLALDNVYIHLYGKTTTKPYRKMGHITILGSTLEEARQKAQYVKTSLRVISV